MDIKLDGPQVKEVVAAAVLQHLDQNKRDELVKAALAHLMTPQKRGTYGRESSTPLEDAFKNACALAARERVVAMFKEGGSLREKLDSVVEESVKTAFEGDMRDKLISNIAEAITSAFWNSR
jgi:hypothetical protein